MKVKIDRSAFLKIYFVMMLITSYKGSLYIAILSIMILLLYFGLFDKSIEIENKMIMKIEAMFVVYCTVITFFSYTLGRLNGIYDFFHYVANIFLVSGITIFILSKRGDIERLYLAIRNTGWILFLFGIIEYAMTFNITHQFLAEGYRNQLLVLRRISSIFAHPIVYAYFLGVLLLILMYKPYKYKSLNIAYVGLLILNLIFSQSRSAMVSLLIIMILLGFNKILHSDRRKHQKKIKWMDLIVLVLLTLIVLILFYLFRNQISAYLTNFLVRISNGLTGYDQGIRITVISNFWSYIKNANIFSVIFGHGCGYSFQFMIDNAISAGGALWNGATDNMYISLMLDYGLIGLIIFVTPILFAIRSFFSNMRFDYCRLNSMIVIFTAVEFLFFEGMYWTVPFFFFILSGTQFSEIER